MRRRRGIACCAVLLGLLLAGGAAAESTTPLGVRGLWRARSADVAGRGVFEGGVASALHTRFDAADARHAFSVTDLHLGYGPSRYFEVGVSVPVRAWWAGNAGLEPADHGGFGDLQASAKLQLPVGWQTLRLGGGGTVSLPTGSRSRGWSSEAADVELGGLVTLDFTRSERFLPVRLHANASYRWNRNESAGVGLAPLDAITRGGFWPPAYPAVPPGESAGYNDQILWRGAVEFSTRVVCLFTEFSVESFPNLPGKAWRDQPVVLTPGALVKFRNGFNLKGGADLSLQRDAPPATLPRLPDWRIFAGVSWRAAWALGDKDHDGVPDSRDRCPHDAEDYDGFEDEDGCPDRDNDGDGIPDRDDLAPNLPEDLDGFEDRDGRPDLDNDGDGIRDADDDCPNEAEDFDGDRDTDGCPDTEAAPGPEPRSP